MSVVTQPAGSICSVPLVEINISGSLDAARLSTTGAILDAALRLRPERLVVDLAQCSGIDAAAIEMLLTVHRALARDGARLTLREPTPRLQWIFEIARVDNVLHTVFEPAAGRLDETAPDVVPASPVPDVYNRLNASRGE